MYGLKMDWCGEQKIRHFVLEDYEAGVPRWCPGCGDHAALSAVQRLARDQQMAPEQTVVVSGIGCSSRFPHYMKTYGFHSLHGRPLPVACGVRSRRPDLNIFVVTGDGDCCAIGTAHWIHAIRYNMNLTVLMFDNNIYGLTKMQTSPTTPKGLNSFTHPEGAMISPIDPLATTLSVTNVSFVAQTVDWNPAHMYATIKAGHEHKGLAFIRILQRCPHYMDGHFDPIRKNPSAVVLLKHDDGIAIDQGVERLFPNKLDHDPSDMRAARDILAGDLPPVGLLYRNENAERYDVFSSQGVDMSQEDRMRNLDETIDRFLI